MHEFHLQTIGPAGDCAVLQLAGEVDLYTAPALRQRIQDLAAKGAVHVIADMSRVDFIDSTGLGALIGGLRVLREHDGSLILVISTRRILRVFELTGLTKVFPPQPSVAVAVTADPHWRQAARSEAGGTEEWCRQHALS
jgi:anti-sigma B factor antagonist